MPVELLDEIVRSQKAGRAAGIVSICSSHPSVLKAAVLRTVRSGAALLVESTCNQVNQFGGYTGMRPADFAAFVGQIARQNGLPPGRVLLGGDHLGPSPWQGEPAEIAMEKAARMVSEYVAAGYAKLHLDASMRLGGDDPTRPLEAEISARRTAALAQAAEQNRAKLRDGPTPRYVVGTDVPIPGGAQDAAGGQESGARPQVTPVDDLQSGLELTREAFLREKLESAWERVRAVVVQPGVEFGSDFVHAYRPEEAGDLKGWIESQPGLVFEAHSTDYQSRLALGRMVRDHFAVLKVGPALTCAYREAVFALARIEDELFPQEERSQLVETLDEAMCRDPRAWQNHYRGSPAELAFARKFSLSDRARYYWPEASVQDALARLLANLSSRPVPETLFSQYAPEQLRRLRAAGREITPETVLLDRIEGVLEDYGSACGE